MQLGDMKTAYELAVEAGSEQKWKQLAELATAESKFVLAQECLHKAQDFGGLLLLATSAGEFLTSFGKLKFIFLNFISVNKTVCFTLFKLTITMY